MPSRLVALCLILAPFTRCWADAPVDYAHDIKPVLERRCFACHGALKQESSLRLDTGASIRTGGDGGPAIVPGDMSASALVQRIASSDDSERMPPEGAPLSAEEIRKISDWIAAGANSPADEAPQLDPTAHWAFLKPGRPEVPHVDSDTPGNPIDAFIDAQLRAQELEPLPEADKSVLLRRVHLDLIGLPPTADELRSYLADESPDAYEKVVDRLLQNPAHGERWGRHWMDVWRYSDWYGRRAVPDVMNSYPQIWRWRDWIVASLNEDKGYDRMVQEMLAADELCPGDDENVVATGFLVRNWFKWNYENWMKDNVEHTAKAFLGITFNCAHCHDHKYDPITQEDYFRFRAFFEPLELRQDRVPGLPDPGPFKKYVYADAYGPIAAGLIRVFDEKLTAETFMYVKGDSRNRMEGKPPVQPGAPAFLAGEEFAVPPVKLSAEAYYPGLKAALREEDTAKLQAELVAAEQALATSKEALAGLEHKLAGETLLAAEQAALDAQLSVHANEQQVTAARARLRSLQARIAADDAKYHGQGDATVLAQAAFRAEKQAAYALAQLELEKIEAQHVVAERSAAADASTAPALEQSKQQLAAARAAVDAARSGLTAVGDSYTPLSPLYPTESTGRRLALAKWIASPENPLTARVAVNHIWLRHFGRALVDTPSNFGRSGRPPSHPELLDWLAVELMEQGWQMKHIHRLIVTSRAYRRRSNLGASTHANVAKDPDNVLLWRANTRRMEAEVVRDSLLACAKELDATLGGPELDAAQGLTARRRSIYFAIHGEAKMQFLELFDAADVCDCYQRTASVRPQQALALTNSELPLQLSRQLAAKLWAEIERLQPDDSQRNLAFVREAFETILSRSPTDLELEAAGEFLTQQSETLSATSSQDQAAAPTVGVQAPAHDLQQRARETMIHALFNHNDFVTIR
ncbi:MAG: DUF1553 domain-containing protein [Pirellulales bacterium]